jgi:hypothetical protein
MADLFKIDGEPTFEATVQIPAPGGARPLKVAFKWLDRDAFAAYCKDGKEKGDAQFLFGLLERWEADAACDEAGITRLLAKYPQAGRAIFEVYQKELLGVEAKN